MHPESAPVTVFHRDQALLGTLSGKRKQELGKFARWPRNYQQHVVNAPLDKNPLSAQYHVIKPHGKARWRGPRLFCKHHPTKDNNTPYVFCPILIFANFQTRETVEKKSELKYSPSLRFTDCLHFAMVACFLSLHTYTHAYTHLYVHAYLFSVSEERMRNVFVFVYHDVSWIPAEIRSVTL